jgi:hypothetical protein
MIQMPAGSKTFSSPKDRIAKLFVGRVRFMPKIAGSLPAGACVEGARQPQEGRKRAWRAGMSCVIHAPCLSGLQQV